MQLRALVIPIIFAASVLLSFSRMPLEEVKDEKESFFAVRNKHEQTFQVSFGSKCGTDSPLGK